MKTRRQIRYLNINLVVLGGLVGLGAAAYGAAGCDGATGADGAPDTLRWQAQAVIVTTSLAHDGSIPIPDDVLQGIARWQQLQGDTA